MNDHFTSPEDDSEEYTEGKLLLACNGCGKYHAYTLVRKMSGGAYLLDKDGNCVPMFYQDLEALKLAQDVAWTDYLQSVVQTGDDYLQQVFRGQRPKAITQAEAQGMLERYITMRQKDADRGPEAGLPKDRL